MPGPYNHRAIRGRPAGQGQQTRAGTGPYPLHPIPDPRRTYDPAGVLVKVPPPVAKTQAA